MLFPSLPYQIIIVASGFLFICGFLLARKIEKGFVNALTLNLFVNFPTLFVFPLLASFVATPGGSVYAYAYLYLSIIAAQFSFMLGFYRYKPGYFRISHLSGAKHLRILCLVFTVASALIFSQLFFSNFGIRGVIQVIYDPRILYLLTRTGGGSFFFVSSFLSLISIILALFLRGQPILKAALLATNTFIVYLHGSKAQLIDILFIFLYYQTYVKGAIIKIKRFVRYGVLIILLTSGIFAFLQRNIYVNGSLFDQMISYSDYIPNAAILIDSNMPPQYGVLTFENNIVSLIPRPLWPGKPRDFGSLYLAEKFFPEAFEADTGAPAFLFGAAIADFGVFAIVYISMINFVIGAVGKVFYVRCIRTKAPLDFVLFLSILGVNIWPIGVGWQFPELFVICLFLGLVLSSRVSRVSGKKMNFASAGQAPRQILDHRSFP